VFENVVQITSCEGTAGTIDPGLPPTGLLAIQELATELESWPLSHLESKSQQQAAAEAFPRAYEFLGRAQDLFVSIGSKDEEYNDTSSTGSTPEDIAFFTLHELSTLQRTLSQVETSVPPTWRLIEACEQMRGQLMKACWALHLALCRRANYECEDLTRASELAKAIRVRTRLAKFRGNLAAGLQTTGDEVTRRMRLAGTLIAMMIGSNEYPDFRISDRVLIGEIQQEILGWLISPIQEPREALRIWEDLMGFVELSRGINRRVELQEHDEQALRRLFAALQRYSPTEVFPTELRPMAQPLRGLEPALDELIESSVPLSVGLWLQRLRESQPEESIPTCPSAATAFRPAEAALACFA